MNQLLIISLLFTGVIASCNTKKTEEEKAATNGEMEHHEGDDHAHDFACPMHPDMRGHEGEKCNKCGMPLEHMDHDQVEGNYMMEMKASETTLVAGKSVSLSFIPKNKDNTTAMVPLDVEHEKKIHLIAVSHDLSWFDHIHPAYQADGTYVVKETFPNGGTYLLYADYKPSGSTHKLEKIEVQVEGKSKPVTNYATSKTNATSGEFSVVLKPDGTQFLSNQEIHFDGQFSKGGKRFDVNGLQTYLGAKGHMVGIHVRNKTYVHLHPEVENDILHFHATFPEAGMYRAWLQFMAEDKLHTVDFTIMVEQGSEADAGNGDHDEEESDHHH